MGIVNIGFISIVYLFAGLAHGQDHEGFKLVKQEGTTAIYERWITFPNSNPPIEAREVKGEFYFNNTIFAGLNLIQDEKKIQLWQKHVSEFKVYPQLDTMGWIEYSYHDIPWPVSDQDHLLEYRIEKLIPGRLLFLSFESREDLKLAPVRKGVTRMELSGSWTWEQVSPDRVKVTYRILSKPIGIPKWLTDPIIRSNIMTTIEEYVALLEPEGGRGQ